MMTKQPLLATILCFLLLEQCHSATAVDSSDGRGLDARQTNVDGTTSRSVVPDASEEYQAELASTVRGNVEVRRWVGTRIDGGEVAAQDLDVPVAIFARSAVDPSAERWRGFWNEGRAHDRGVVTFKPVPVSGGRLQTMILPAGAVQPTVAALVDRLGVNRGDIHVFTLSPLNRGPVEMISAAEEPSRQETESRAP